MARALRTLLTVILLPATMQASAAAAEVLTLRQVLADVENVNLSVLTSREFITQAEEEVIRTRSGVRPLVNLRASQARSDLGTGEFNDFQAGVFASMRLLDLRQYENLRAAKQGVDLSRSDYENALQNVMAAVTLVYFDHLRNLAFDDVIDSNIERAGVLLELAQNQLNAGVTTQIDVTRAEAEVVTQQQLKLQQETVILGSELRVKQLLNMDLGGPLQLEDFRVRREPAPAMQLSDLETVLENRADYRTGLAAVEQARILNTAAGRERVPTVDVFAQGGVSSGLILDGEEIDFWSAGVELSMPVWDARRIGANVRSAESRVRQEEFQLANLRHQIEAEMRIALQDVASKLAQIAVAEKNLALAREELELARVRYEQGVADNRELIDAENRFTVSSFNLVNAIYSYHVARLELARARGDVRLILNEQVP